MADTPARPLRWLPLLVVAGLALTACGDDDGEDTTTVTTDDAAAVATDAAADPTAESTAPTESAESDGAVEPVTIAIVSVTEGFAPPTVEVGVGTDVVWTNVDGIAHTATADDGSWDSGNLGVGESFAFVADEPGTYSYLCSIHPSMVGELVVE